MDDAERWLRLVHAPGIGPATGARLLERFGSIDRVCAAGRGELRDAGIGADAAAVLHGASTPAGIERDLAWSRHDDCHLLGRAHPAYPRRLTELPDPPLLLYVRGDPEVLAVPALAIVGSRHPTPAGIETATEFARHLAASGLVIVSGLARGIDAAAHEGALAGGGLTVAVAGTGLDRVYPARHAELARRIAAEGALVSEFALGTRPTRAAFPRRNRIVAGLCLGTLVVEAARQSGSLVSARHAMEQGREVFAIPGSIHNPVSRGCHQLIRQGAKLVETADDILEELGPQVAGAGQRTPPVAAQPAPATESGAATGTPADPAGERVLAAVDWEPRGVDELAARSGLDAGAAASTLLRLELDGRVRQLPGGLYQRR